MVLQALFLVLAGVTGRFRSGLLDSSGIVTVDRAVSTLSEEMGVKVVVPASLGRHLIFVRGGGRSSKDVLTAIATCLLGSVVSEGKHVSIRRSQ